MFYCHLRNIQDSLSDGKTPYERRFGEPFKGPIILFGSLVEYYCLCERPKTRIHKFGKKVLPGLLHRRLVSDSRSKRKPKKQCVKVSHGESEQVSGRAAQIVNNQRSWHNRVKSCEMDSRRVVDCVNAVEESERSEVSSGSRAPKIAECTSGALEETNRHRVPLASQDLRACV